MDLRISNHVAVITGGASGIGRAIAAAFHAEGAHVAIWDVAEDVVEVAGTLQDQAGTVGTLGVRLNICDEAAVQRALEETEARLGPIDHLVHAAAIGSGKFGFPFTNLTPANWPRVLEVNIMGMVNVAHTIAPGMMERRRGTMVFIASVAGQIGSPTDPPYSASKAAGINFAQCMARDLAPFGIRVNTVCPGMVKTPLNESVWKAWYDRQPAGKRQSYEEWASEKIQQRIPLGTWQQPEDVADLVLFLSSARARQITGQTMNVDGGFVMHW